MPIDKTTAPNNTSNGIDGAGGAGPWARLWNDPAWFFAACALFFGVLSCALTPPLQPPDEFSHFLRAYDISQGHVLSADHEGKVGNFLPESLRAMQEAYKPLVFSQRKASFGQLREQFRVALNPRERGWFTFAGSSVYFPALYLPQAAAIRLSAVAGSGLAQYYAARLFALLSSTLVVCWAISLAPSHKWLLALLALSPMFLYQAASCSADAVTNAVAFLAFACFLRFLRQESPLSVADVAAILALAVALTVCKAVYAPVALLFCLLPEGRYARFGRFVLLALIVVFSAASLVAWNAQVAHMVKHVPLGVDPKATLAHILADPFAALAALSNTWKEYALYDLGAYVGYFGHFNYKLPTPLRMLWLATVALYCLLLPDGSRPLGGRRAMWVFGLSLVLIVGVYAALLVTCTPPGEKYIRGVQGRYFIPLGPLFFASLASLSAFVPARSDTVNRAALSAIKGYGLFMLCALLLATYSRYY